MNVSVIISSYNGRNKLPNILNCLEKQTLREFETIVVLDGSTDGSDRLLKSLKTTLNIKIIKQSNQGRSQVRNAGAYAAAGKLLIFFDDDMIPLEDCVESHITFHTKFPLSIATGPQVFLNAEDYFSQYKFLISSKWAMRLEKLECSPLPFSYLYLTAANCSLPKEVFLQIGGFDPCLTDAEDFDLAVRAYKAGFNIYYNSKAFAWHNDPVDVIGYIKRLREYEQAQLKLRLQNPSLYADITIRKAPKLKGLKKIGFSLLAQPIWLYAVQSNTFLALLPKRLRNKIFDLVTHAYGVFFIDLHLL